MAVRCPHCGANSPDPRNCLVCGTPLAPPIDGPPSKPPATWTVPVGEGPPKPLARLPRFIAGLLLLALGAMLVVRGVVYIQGSTAHKVVRFLESYFTKEGIFNAYRRAYMAAALANFLWAVSILLPSGRGRREQSAEPLVATLGLVFSLFAIGDFCSWFPGSWAPMGHSDIVAPRYPEAILLGFTTVVMFWLVYMQPRLLGTTILTTGIAAALVLLAIPLTDKALQRMREYHPVHVNPRIDDYVRASEAEVATIHDLELHENEPAISHLAGETLSHSLKDTNFQKLRNADPHHMGPEEQAAWHEFRRVDADVSAGMAAYRKKDLNTAHEDLSAAEKAKAQLDAYAVPRANTGSTPVAAE